MQNLQRLDEVPVPAPTEQKSSQQDEPQDSLDALILQKERELRPIKWRMDELRIAFINQFTEFATGWYTETARDYVTKHPQITLNMSRERLAELKSRVNDLSANANKIVKGAFSDHQIWWHQSLNLHDSASQYEQLGDDEIGNKFPAKIDTPIRRALGELGVVLEQYGFRITTKPCLKFSFPEFWFRAPEDPMADAFPYYPHMLTWSDPMQYTIQRYNTQFKQALAVYKEIWQLKEQKKQWQASNLWDST